MKKNAIDKDFKDITIIELIEVDTVPEAEAVGRAFAFELCSALEQSNKANELHNMMTDHQRKTLINNFGCGVAAGLLAVLSKVYATHPNVVDLASATSDSFVSTFIELMSTIDDIDPNNIN